MAQKNPANTFRPCRRFKDLIITYLYRFVNQTISPLYQYIRDFNGDTAPSGAPDANYFEPLLDQITIHFNKLRKIYEALEEEN